MYNYEDLKPSLFTEDGFKKILKARDNVARFLATAGAFTMGNAISGIGGDSWTSMACIDYLVEIGEIREITGESKVMGQHRVFVGVIT